MITDGDSKAYGSIWDTYGCCDKCEKWEKMDKWSAEYKKSHESKEYEIWKQNHESGKAECKDFKNWIVWKIAILPFLIFFTIMVWSDKASTAICVEHVMSFKMMYSMLHISETIIKYSQYTMCPQHDFSGSIPPKRRSGCHIPARTAGNIQAMQN